MKYKNLALRVLLFCSIIGVLMSCTKNKSNEYNIVKITSDDFLANYSRSCSEIIYNIGDSLNGTHMLMKEGDLILVGNYMFYKSNPAGLSFFVF